MIRYRMAEGKWVPYVPLDEKDFAQWDIDEPTDHDDDAPEFTLADLLKAN